MIEVKKENVREGQVTRRGFLVRAATLALALGKLGALAQSTRTARWNGDMELAVKVEIDQPSSGRYQRPYVAVWIEDASGKAVRTLALWVDASGRGSRYIPELRRWFRDEQALGEAGDLVSTVSSPTRMAGKYSLVWDGKNDRKAAVDQGEYFVCVEAAREHGTYQLIRQKVTIGEKPFSLNLEGNVEIRGVTVEYRKRT